MIKPNYFRQIIKRTYSSVPVLPECEFTPEKYKVRMHFNSQPSRKNLFSVLSVLQGPDLSKLQEIRKYRLNPALTTYYGTPLALHQGHRQWLFDINGKRYLDMFGGICTVSVGHSHPKITEAVNNQIKRLGHVSNVYFHEKIHEYAIRLTDKFPGDLKVVYLVNSGSEANDLAVLMARSYTKNYDIITLKNCYHGMTYQTMALTSNTSYKYAVPQAGGVFNVMSPDVFKGLWGGSHCRDGPVQATRSCSCSPSKCEAANNYIDQFKEVFKYNVRKGRLAAFFAESVQGVGGTVQFPKGYIKEVHRIVKDNGGVFVSDEVQTGFGRTGEHFWGFEMHGIQPDIVTMAKGIGNGYPLAAVVTTPAIAQALAAASHFNTYGGNPIACTVGISVLDIIEEENLQQNSLKVGTHLLNELHKLQQKHEIIGDVRGKGLMIGVELVEHGTIPLSSKKFLQVMENCRDLGLIVGKGGVDGNVLRIKPPMCITPADADFTVDVLDMALEQIK